MTVTEHVTPRTGPLTAADRDRRLGALAEAEAVLPDWGLGDGAHGESTGSLRRPLPPGGLAVLTAATALVLSRYDGVRRLTVLRTSGAAHGPTALAALPVADETTAGELRAAAGEQLARPWPPAEGGPAAGAVAAREAAYCTVQVAGESAGRPSATCPLTVTAGRDSARYDFRRAQFDGRIVGRFADHTARAAAWLSGAGPESPLSGFELVGPAERREVAALGDPGLPAPGGLLRLDQQVAARAAGSPDAVAVRYGTLGLTYRDLDEQANRLAHALAAHGVRRGDRVGVRMARSARLVVLLLAVLRAGASYVPMEPDHPAERHARIVEDAAPVLVVTDGSAETVGPCATVSAADLASFAESRPATPPETGGTPDDTAYVVYTSGSTGRPKGVAVTHRNVASLIAGTTQEFGFGAQDVWVLFHSFAFDMSVWEIWGALTTGGRLVVAPALLCRSPEEFHTLLAAEGVTVLNQTPTAFAQLVDADRSAPRPLSVRLVTFGGEPLDTRMLLPWLHRHPPGDCRLVNLYGITEATVHSTWQDVGSAEAAAAVRSVGTALPGERLSVRDRQGRLVPPGVAGEIHVGGAGVAEGYLNRPELTRQRFLPDPEYGDRMYRSGDRGRLLPDGRLEHLGRLDHQVKLRGHRIELDEVRSALLSAPGVRAAAVVVHRTDPDDPATDRLDAYVVTAENPAQAIRDHAARLLPDYMTPSTVTVLTALPLTGNGKLDRAALPSPDEETQPPAAPGGPSGAETAEQRLLRQWRALVRRPVGPDDDFFETGGNSILVGRLVKSLPSIGLPKTSLRTAYLNPTVRRLAGALHTAQAGEVTGA